MPKTRAEITKDYKQKAQYKQIKIEVSRRKYDQIQAYLNEQSGSKAETIYKALMYCRDHAANLNDYTPAEDTQPRED